MEDDIRPVISGAVEQVPVTSGKRYKVTLVNGLSFSLGTKKFDANVPVIVSAEEAMTLKDKHTNSAIVDPNIGAVPYKNFRFRIEEADDVATNRVITPPKTATAVAARTRVRVRG